jgi:hypothetical protein
LPRCAFSISPWASFSSRALAVWLRAALEFRLKRYLLRLDDSRSIPEVRDTGSTRNHSVHSFLDCTRGRVTGFFLERRSPLAFCPSFWEADRVPKTAAAFAVGKIKLMFLQVTEARASAQHQG